jgi:hypothetical protein
MFCATSPKTQSETDFDLHYSGFDRTTTAISDDNAGLESGPEKSGSLVMPAKVGCRLEVSWRTRSHRHLESHPPLKLIRQPISRQRCLFFCRQKQQ